MRRGRIVLLTASGHAFGKFSGFLREPLELCHQPLLILLQLIEGAVDGLDSLFLERQPRLEFLYTFQKRSLSGFRHGSDSVQ